MSSSRESLAELKRLCIQFYSDFHILNNYYDMSRSKSVKLTKFFIPLRGNISVMLFILLCIYGITIARYSKLLN